MITGLGTKDPVRGIRNQLTDNYFEMARTQISLEELMKPLTGSLSRAVDGDMETGSIQAGQIAGMLNEIKTVREVVEGVMAEAEQVLQRMKKLEA